MVPLKPWITGQRTPPSRDLVSCQKCFRGAGLKYDDMASVGDPTHHTFFEMLGNWSIGHYFKEGAIDYAWEFSTKVLGLDPDRLWPSIYPDDTEFGTAVGRADRRSPRTHLAADRELVGGGPDRPLRLRQRAVLRLGRSAVPAGGQTARRRTSAGETASRSSGTWSSWSSTSSRTALVRCSPTPRSTPGSASTGSSRSSRATAPGTAPTTSPRSSTGSSPGPRAAPIRPWSDRSMSLPTTSVEPGS